MKKKLIITIGLLVIFFTGFHLLISNSEGFAVSSKYLWDNSEVNRLVGNISKTSLIPLTSDLKEEGNEGIASYHIKIVGNTCSAEGVVTSVKTNGKWKVHKAHLILENKDIIILKQ